MLVIDTTVNFATHEDAALNTTFNNVKVISTLDYRDAKIHVDVAARHAIMWPFITDRDRFKNDPASYKYFRIEFPNGDRTVVGEAWINPSSITVVEAIVKETTLYFDNVGQQTRFEALMAANRLKYAYK